MKRLSRRFNSALLNTILVLVSVLVAVLGVELFGRYVLEPSLLRNPFPRIRTCRAPANFLENGTLYRSHPILGWSYYPGSQFFEKRSRNDSWHLHTYDRNGFRNNYDSGDRGVFFLGDSFIRGRLASDRATVPYLLDRWLPEVFFRNYAVGGYATINQLRTYEYFSERVNHDLVVLGYYFRDVIENVEYYEREQKGSDPRDHSPLRRYVPGLDEPLFVERLLVRSYARARTYLLRKDPFHVGWTPYPTGSERERKIGFTMKILKRLVSAVRSNGAELLIVPIPPSALINPEDVSGSFRRSIEEFQEDQLAQLRRIADREAVHYFYPDDHLKRVQAETGRLYGLEDTHLNERGQRVLAASLYEWGIKRGFFSDSGANLSRRYTRNYPHARCPR